MSRFAENEVLQRHVQAARQVFDEVVLVDGQHKAVCVWPLRLLPPFDLEATSLVIGFSKVAADAYPRVPPRDFYVSDQLRYDGRRLRDFHVSWAPEGYAQLCMEEMEGWLPEFDDLVTLVQMIFVRLHAITPADLE